MRRSSSKKNAAAHSRWRSGLTAHTSRFYTPSLHGHVVGYWILVVGKANGLELYMSSSFHDLRVWQQGMKLALRIHRASSKFPKSEMYGLTSQIRRSALSIPSNIAEGKGRHTEKDFRLFLFHARGSLMELQTQIIFARELGYWTKPEADAFIKECAELGGGLTGLINYLTERQKSIKPQKKDH